MQDIYKCFRSIRFIGYIRDHGDAHLNISLGQTTNDTREDKDLE
jgi:hypothetical protein